MLAARSDQLLSRTEDGGACEEVISAGEGVSDLSGQTRDTDPLVDRLEHTLSEFLLPLRMGEGVLEAALDDVLRAVRECGEAWASDTVMPKRAAMLLSDAYAWMYGC